MHVLNSGLVGCWLLNEGAGTKVIDLNTRGKFDGALNNTGAYWRGGQRGMCVDFNASNGFVRCPANVAITPSGFPSGSQARTISFWAMNRSRRNDSNFSIIQYGNTASAPQQGFHLQWALVGNVHQLFTDGVNAGNNISLTIDQLPKTGQWGHCVFTYGSGLGTNHMWKYYFNGKLTKTGVFPTAINTIIGGGLDIGRRSSTNGFMSGAVEDVRLWNRVLSDNEAYMVYAMGERAILPSMQTFLFVRGRSFCVLIE